jgi:hypothetical protein
MKRASAAIADLTLDVEQNVFARQMFWQGSAPWLRGPSFGDDRRLIVLNAYDIAVDIFQTESQLVGINTFGTASELHALQLIDDGFEALDLGVAMVDSRGCRAPGAEEAQDRKGDCWDRAACPMVREHADSKNNHLSVEHEFLRVELLFSLQL